MRVFIFLVKLALLLAASIVVGALAMSLFTIKIPISSVKTTTVGDTTVTTTCTGLSWSPSDWGKCTTTRVRRPK